MTQPADRINSWSCQGSDDRALAVAAVEGHKRGRNRKGAKYIIARKKGDWGTFMYEQWNPFPPPWMRRGSLLTTGHTGALLAWFYTKDVLINECIILYY